jgi:hypothetical protein
MSEDAHQIALMSWMQLALKMRPQLAMAFHVPNGGSRNKIEAAKLKRMGVKRGVPDVVLMVARGGFHGMCIELKSLTGRTSPEQKDWIERLTAEGYLALVCKGWIQAKSALENYLDGTLTTENT